MITPHHITAIDTANKALQTAWKRVQTARQCGNPIVIENAVMSYLQALQRVNVVVETAITTK